MECWGPSRIGQHARFSESRAALFRSHTKTRNFGNPVLSLNIEPGTLNGLLALQILPQPGQQRFQFLRRRFFGDRHSVRTSVVLDG